ncbi:hypothetical protein [Streptacidiphilus sp. P02-A3a]|uniref:hypothetical protein n=1 Tax=Streptacidiphilus sp. P02-A3a TaxID=2704468 RepID=UPI0015FD5FB2|nr:hypothetical protein [Streptacidiphilus sp. P02-A3a]QMU68408.1 hypothetical protein GXP74_09400 [Streptacidiphilus sp. P02-A3a]
MTRAFVPGLELARLFHTEREREQFLSPAYEFVAGLHNRLCLTAPLDPKVRRFHDRPFQVLDSFRFTDALIATVTDPAVRALPQRSSAGTTA